jgi:hypothetical protein
LRSGATRRGAAEARRREAKERVEEGHARRARLIPTAAAVAERVARVEVAMVGRCWRKFLVCV